MFSACNAAWPRRTERRELSVIKIRSSMPLAAYQRVDANPTIHMQMRFLGSTIDPKLVADQLGHGLRVNLDVYTVAALEKRQHAVEVLEASLVNPEKPRPNS